MRLRELMMQQTSKGTLSEREQDNIPDDEMKRKNSTSAFRPVSNCEFQNQTRSENRDSGYFTDNSPAMFNNNPQRFTFDHTHLRSEPDMNLNDSNPSNFYLPEDEDENEDDVDEEVEMVMTHTNEEPPSPPPTSRPQAPILRDEVRPSSDNSVNIYNNQNLYHTFSARRLRSHPYNHFMPITERNIGTQTPNITSQLITEVTTINHSFIRFHPNRLPVNRGKFNLSLNKF